MNEQRLMPRSELISLLVSEGYTLKELESWNMTDLETAVWKLLSAGK